MSTNSRPARTLTMLVVSAVTVLTVGLVNQGVAFATEKCSGGQFDGYTMTTWRDKQLCRDGGGTVRQGVTDDGTIVPDQMLEQ